MSSTLETTVPFHNHNKRRAKTPSFSSILLDAIYRSIDEDHHHHADYPQTTPTSPTHTIIKQRNVETHASELVQRRTKMRSDSTLETVDLRRAIMIDSWMEKQPPPPQKKHHFHLGEVLDQKGRILRQKSVPSRARAPDNCSSTHNDNLSSSSCFTNLAPRSSRDQSSSRIFTKTKSRALKIYGELKKPKNQSTPISPGRRIAAFLNSIFRNTSNSPATRRTCSPENPLPSAPVAVATTTISNSTCSTASSFSRSCLSNKTSSSGKSTPAATTKRSVRFCPVSVILDEDSRPCGHKSLHKNENEGCKKRVSPRPVNGSGVEQQKWRREKEIDALMMMIKSNCEEDTRRHVSSFDEEEMKDDEGSCASSDLFELENFSSIGGVSRYYEELPVYGTTSLKNITA